jgi:stage II sporulation protein D
MRALIAISALALLAAGSAGAGTTFVVEGRGWGHGVGMSQYGAFGFARHGWRY